MVATITPAVHGGRTGAYWATLAVHAAAATVAAAAVGAALGGAGALLGAPWGAAGTIAVAVVALAYLGREAAGVPVPLLERRAQVPEWWRAFFSPAAAAGLYGAGLGVGFATHLRFGTYVAVAAAVLASGSPGAGALVCGAFGAARAAAVAAGARARDGDEAEAALESIERLGRTRLPATVNAAALAGIVAVAIVAS